MPALILLIVLAIPLTFLTGLAIGESNVYNGRIDDLCERMYTQTSDYLECSQKSLNDVLVEIPCVK